MVMSSKTARRTSEADELVNAIHGVVLSLFRDIAPTFEAEGISKGQFWAMHVLSSKRSASVDAVARHLAVSAPTMCVTVDQLEEAGLVTRRRSAQDRRKVELLLTPRGEEAEARIWSKIGERVSQELVGLPRDDLTTSVRVFRELNRRLDAQGARS